MVRDCVLESYKRQQTRAVDFKARAHVVLGRRHGQGRTGHQRHQVGHEEHLPDVEPGSSLYAQLNNELVGVGGTVLVCRPGLRLRQRDARRLYAPLRQQRVCFHREAHYLHRLVVVVCVLVRPPDEVHLLQVDDLPVEWEVFHVEDLEPVEGECGGTLPIHSLVRRLLTGRHGCPREILPDPALLYFHSQRGHADARNPPQAEFRLLLRVLRAEGPVALHSQAEGALLRI
mmetsp:Transcript_8427/g.19753  ORF Transcript_8427/g.19753 Transcript_8427/m.19753 type:complete len:230 (+) Transcript_8427:565-1254(+)